jgi:hypothetical protein
MNSIFFKKLASHDFSSKSTSMISGSDFELLVPLPPPEKKSPGPLPGKPPLGCHTMLPQPPQRITWFL